MMRARIAHAAVAGALALAAAAAAPAAVHADQMAGGRMVKGQIEVTYFALGGPTPYEKWGATLTDELPDRRGGKFQNFAKSSIYWHPNADRGNAHQIGGAIYSKWGELGWETSSLGYPVSDERRTTVASVPGLNWGQKVTGAWNDFQGGKIMWTAQHGAHPVWGEIQKIFDAAGGVNKYGWPVGDERRTSDGRFVQDFQKGAITWPAQQA